MPNETRIGSTSPAADDFRTSSTDRADAIPLPSQPGRQLEKLSVVIPARDEAGCIASTVEHLHLELNLHGINHEIVVVDDGSRDETYAILESTTARIPAVVPVRSPGPHGFGRAIQRGFDAFSGDAVVIMMADESDDCRDVVRYWRILQEGHDCVFGSRFMRGGRNDRLSLDQVDPQSLRELFHPHPVRYPPQRHDECLQSLSAGSHRRLSALPVAALQHHGRTAAESDRPGLLVDGDSDHLAQPANRRGEAQDP
jgi:glycosyltransferase involved in cell wall biosynthesis